MLNCPKCSGNEPQKTKIITQIPKMRDLVKNVRGREVHWNSIYAINSKFCKHIAFQRPDDDNPLLLK